MGPILTAPEPTRGAYVTLLLLLLFVALQFAKFFTFTWTFGQALCKGVHYVQNVSVICSVLTLTTMSLERPVKDVYIQFQSVTSLKPVAALCHLLKTCKLRSDSDLKSIYFNPLKCGGIRRLHLKVFSVIQV